MVEKTFVSVHSIFAFIEQYYELQKRPPFSEQGGKGMGLVFLSRLEIWVLICVLDGEEKLDRTVLVVAVIEH